MSILIHFFIKDYKNYTDPKVRSAYGKTASIFGIFLNIILFISKLIVGVVFNSVSITADAFNNLADAGSSIIALVSFIFASKPADHDHPYGHERLEYIFSLLVAFIIMFFSFQLIMNSIQQILHPTSLDFGVALIITLVFSIVIKAYMYYYNTKYAKLLNSTVMRSTAIDSISDVAATSAVLIGLFISVSTGLQLDGYLGIVVALFIAKGGYEIIVDTFNKLIGEAPDPQFIKEIMEKIRSYDGVLNVHDIVVHEYGPQKTFVTVHVEVDSKIDILISHDRIDTIEKDFREKEQIELVIHMDPIVIHDDFVNKMKIIVMKVVKNIDPSYTIYDFRVVKGTTHNNLIFDVGVPIETHCSDDEIIDKIKEGMPPSKIENRFVIHINRNDSNNELLS